MPLVFLSSSTIPITTSILDCLAASHKRSVVGLGISTALAKYSEAAFQYKVDFSSTLKKGYPGSQASPNAARTAPLEDASLISLQAFLKLPLWFLQFAL